MIATPALSADAPTVPLHTLIDRLIEADRVGPPVALASDSEFLRRVSLDLTGMPPSTDELRDFLADSSVDKRSKAIDRLLESPLFSRQLATNLDVVLMERRPQKEVSSDEWQGFLLQACREDRPINQIMKEILIADGVDPDHRAAAGFYLDRESEPNLITRDVGRIFFGRDLQCAQCHDHPLIEDYRQSDYHGLFAFFSQAYPVSQKEGDKEKKFFAEKPGNLVTFDSVFVKNDQHISGPRILGEPELVEPVFPPGDEYQVKPEANTVAVPRFSRRAQLASTATDGTNTLFNENIANRLWALMMGKGLVHPLDLHHPSNPPSHPELLKLLADQIVALNFDTRAFLRELALSQTYQRSIDPPANLASNAEEIASNLSELKTRTGAIEEAAEADQITYDEAVEAWYSAESSLVPVAAEQAQAEAKHAELSKKQAEAQKAVDEVLARIKTLEGVSQSLTEAAAKSQEAAQKLPEEKDLAAAAQKFADRSKAMTTELAALQKTSADKAAALAKSIEEVASSVKPVELARAKALPLHESVRTQEKVVLAARQKMADSRIALEEHRNRLLLLETYMERIDLERQARESTRVVEDHRQSLALAQKTGNEFAVILEQRTEEWKAADQARLSSEKVAKDIEAALASHRKIEERVVEAFQATDAAHQLLPDDSTLLEAAQKLESKVEELRSVSAGLASKVELASADRDRLAEEFAATGRRLEESKAEKKRLEDAVVTEQTALADAESQSKALASKVVAATDELTALLVVRFQVAQLKPLSPEQMCWSILKVTGVYDRHRQAEEAELEKSKPLSPEAKDDPAQVRARAIEVEDRTFAKLKGNVDAFVKVYGAGAGQPQNEFFATADQALFVANAGLVNGWTAPAAGNVADRMVQESDPAKTTEDLYLTVLSRPPTPDESAEVVQFLSEPSGNKPAIVQEWVWGLLTSAEFRFNH